MSDREQMIEAVARAFVEQDDPGGWDDLDTESKQAKIYAAEGALDAVMPDLIDMVAESWKEYRQNTFSGGMIPFDSELSKSANAHLTQGQREELGVDAVFKSFLNFLRSKL